MGASEVLQVCAIQIFSLLLLLLLPLYHDSKKCTQTDLGSSHGTRQPVIKELPLLVTVRPLHKPHDSTQRHAMFAFISHCTHLLHYNVYGMNISVKGYVKLSCEYPVTLVCMQNSSKGLDCIHETEHS